MSDVVEREPVVRSRIVLETLCQNCGEWVAVNEYQQKAACRRCGNVWSLLRTTRRLEVKR